VAPRLRDGGGRDAEAHKGFCHGEWSGERPRGKRDRCAIALPRFLMSSWALACPLSGLPRRASSRARPAERDDGGAGSEAR
jgi:hypothetical protein